MRPLGFSLSSITRLHEAPIPGSRSGRTNWPHRRRLDDALEAVFQRACATNNMDAAADVLAVLEKWHDRRTVKYGSERRIDGRVITAMRAELERLRARIS
jgi:hypothetical protein